MHLNLNSYYFAAGDGWAEWVLNNGMKTAKWNSATNRSATLRNRTREWKELFGFVIHTYMRCEVLQYHWNPSHLKTLNKTFFGRVKNFWFLFQSRKWFSYNSIKNSNFPISYTFHLFIFTNLNVFLLNC